MKGLCHKCLTSNIELKIEGGIPACITGCGK